MCQCACSNGQTDLHMRSCTVDSWMLDCLLSPSRPITTNHHHHHHHPYHHHPYHHHHHAPMAAGRSLLTDIKAELLRLNQGLPFLFVELLTALIQQPSAHAAALSQVMVTLHNMAHLINMARPLQVMLCSVPALYSPLPLICLGGLPSHTLSYPCPWCMQHTCCYVYRPAAQDCHPPQAVSCAADNPHPTPQP